MSKPSIDELVSAGVHFGHRSSRWNPKMKPYIFTTRNHIHVIDLDKTLEKLEKALEFVKQVAAKGGEIIFVGTKRQASDIIKKYAFECGMPYVNIRWLGGTFTNFKTIQKTFRKLERFHRQKESDDFELKYTKKERLLIDRQIGKLENLFEGIKNLKKLPDAIFVVDINHEKIAVKEANDSGVKVIALVDTNSDPDMVDYLIPGNDDAIKSIDLIVSLLSDAAKEGKKKSLIESKQQETTATAEKKNN